MRMRMKVYKLKSCKNSKQHCIFLWGRGGDVPARLWFWVWPSYKSLCFNILVFISWQRFNFLFPPAPLPSPAPCSPIGSRRHVCGSAGSSHVKRQVFWGCFFLPPAECQNPSICHVTQVSQCFAACEVLEKKVLQWGEKNLRASEARDGRDAVGGSCRVVGVQKVQNHQTGSDRNHYNLHLFTLRTRF